jgi:outer membrane protein assembly factor BamA/autotransporter translocation and assembly factor TamB
VPSFSRIGLGLTVPVALVLAVVGAAHTPPARALALRVITASARDAGIDLRVGDFRYNLFLLTADLGRVDAAVLTSSDEPFFSARRIALDLGWRGVVRGRPDVQRIEISGAHVTIHRRSDGSDNLPATSGDRGDIEAGASSFSGPVTIGRLVADDLAVTYADDESGVVVEATGIRAALAPSGDRVSTSSGRFDVGGGVSVQVGGQTTTIHELEGTLVFDGAALVVEDLAAVAREGTLSARGRFDLLQASPMVDVSFDGEAILEEAARWVLTADPPAGGLLFSGRVFGPAGDPEFHVQASGNRLAWRGVTDVSLDLSGSGRSSGVQLERLAARVAGGTLEGRGGLRFREAGALDGWNLAFEWRDIDPMSLAAALTGEPVPAISASIDGSATVHGGGEPAALTADVQWRAGRGATPGVPVSGHGALRAGGGTWTLAHDHRLGSWRFAGSNGGQLRVDDLPASTLGGAVSVTTDDLGRAVRDLGVLGAAIPGGLEDGLDGRLAIVASLAGVLRLPAARFEASATGGTGWTAAPVSASVRGQVTTDELEVTSIDVQVGPNRARGAASARRQTGMVTGEFVVDAPAVEILAATVPSEWRPAGGVSVAATLEGTTSEPRVSGTLTGGPLTAAGQAVEQIAATFHVSGAAFAIENLELLQGPGRASATARFDFATGGYSVRADADEWPLSPLPAGSDGAGGVPVAGWFGGRLEGEGTLDAPAGRLEFEATDLDYGAYPVGAVRLSVDAADGRVSFSGALPDLLATVGGSMDLAAPYPFLATFDVEAADLSRLAGVAPGEVGQSGRTFADALSGALGLSLELVGTLQHPEETAADLEVELRGAAVGGLPVTLARPARFRYRREDLGALDMDLRMGASRVMLDGRLGRQAEGGELRASVDARLEDVLAIARILAPDLDFEGEGSMALEVAARGPLAAPQVTASLRTEADGLVYQDLPPMGNLLVDASYGDGVLRLAGASGTWQGASATVAAEVPVSVFRDYVPASYLEAVKQAVGPAKLSARVQSVRRDALAPFLDEETLAGIELELSGSLDARAETLDLDAIEGQVELDAADFVLARVPFRQLEPTRLRWKDGAVRVEAFRWGGEGNQFLVTGGAAFGDAASLDLNVQGVLDLQMVSAFVPDVATGGTARVQLVARGTVAAPDVRGQIALTDVEVTVPEPRLAIAGLSGTIDAAGDRLSAVGLTGTANGGTVTIGGHVAYPGLSFREGAITVEARQVALALANGAQGEVDADLRLALGGSTDPLLDGRVTLVRGAYRNPISLADLALARGPTVAEATGPAEASFLDRIRLDVAVTTAEDLHVDNNYGRADLGASLRVLGTIGEPGLSGRATIREGGQVFLGGNAYVVEQSTIDFVDPARIEPDLDLRARTRIGRYGITLGVSGTLDRLEHDLQSDPPLSESDIVSVLVTGRTLSEAGSAQTEVARDQVLGYLSGDLLGFAGRALGLDTVRVERGVSADTLPTDLALFAGDEDPASRLTISKYLRHDVEIVLSQNLRESGGLTWIAMYRPFGPVELRTISRDDDTRAYEFRHNLQFGGGVRSGAPASAPGTEPQPRVSAVEYAGDTGADEDRIRSVVGLRAGDRFDFFAWQRDRDAIRSLLQRRGFLEARVGAAREPAGSVSGGSPDEVRLIYTVDRGPATGIRVDGFDLDAGVLERLREAWSRTVFDGFLLDDAREIVRRHLAAEGYVRPGVDVEIAVPGQSVKDLVVRIDPGVRVTSRTLDVAGNRVMPTERLLTSLLPLDAREAGWTDPDVVAVGLERFYRSEGFLSADVTIGVPEIEGVRARLPVTIDEGPRFTLTSVRIDGAAALDEATVRSVAALPEGGVYAAARAEEARRQIEREYRRRGYNAVQTRASAAVDTPTAGVTLTLTIVEGPQQVLADVVVTGAGMTRPGVVSGNLALEPGEPVDLAALYQARRRLYDTNVFRSVELDVETLDGATGSGGEQPVRARVTLEEWPRYRVRYGFQLNDEVSPLAERGRTVSPGLVADIQNRNLLGRAATTGLAVRLQNDYRIARAFFSAPTFIGLPIRSSVFATRSRLRVDVTELFSYVEDLSGISLEQRFRPWSLVDMAYSYRLERKRVFDPDPNPFFPALDTRDRIGRLAATVVAERRDDPFNATRGWFHSSTVEYGPEWLWSDLRFVKYLAQTYYFRPVGSPDRPVVFASAVRLGAGRGFEQDLTRDERFKLGGANSIRGYAEDGLGARDFLGRPLGDNAMLLFNQEVRFPVYRWFGGVAFVDAGNIFGGLKDVSLTDLKVGLGVGLRIQTPFALVRIDRATAQSVTSAERANRWYLSIGQAF